MKYSNILLLPSLFFLMLLVVARMGSDFQYDSEKAVFSEPISSPLFLLASSGPLPSLVADFKVLDSFAVYYAMEKYNKSEYAPFFAQYLKSANLLDPYFFDVYRLASSLLAFDANMAYESVSILEKGVGYLPNNWEIPFFGGFIAHQQLGDDKLAFEFMQQAISRPNAPPIVVYLAGRFLANTNTKEDAIAFLQGVLKTLPKEYQSGIQKKIAELQAEDQP